MTLKWDASPSAAKWYGEAVYVAGNGETEVNYGYCDDIADYPSPRMLSESGSQLLEVRVINMETGDVWESWQLATSTSEYEG